MHLLIHYNGEIRRLSFDIQNEQNDHGELVPMADQIEKDTGRSPDEVSADTGYCSEDNIGALETREIRGTIATGRQKHGTSSPTAEQEKRQDLAPGLYAGRRADGITCRERVIPTGC